MEFNYNDGGCVEAGYATKINQGDCLVRSLAIANYYKYEWAWSIVEIHCEGDRESGPGIGVRVSHAREILVNCGWHRVEQGVLNMEELPRPQDINRIVMLEFTDHVSVMKYGILNDRHKCRGLRLVGMWYRK